MVAPYRSPPPTFELVRCHLLLTELSKFGIKMFFPSRNCWLVACSKPPIVILIVSSHDLGVSISYLSCSRIRALLTF